jgi:hypothetical protein
MTRRDDENDRPTPDAIAIRRRWWERLTWPQVGALAIAVSGVLGLLHAMPAEVWERLDWTTVGSIVLTLLGLGGSAAAGPLFRRGENE